MSLKLTSISVTDCVALNCSLNEVTPAPTISVPEETAEFVAAFAGVNVNKVSLAAEESKETSELQDANFILYAMKKELGRSLMIYRLRPLK